MYIQDLDYDMYIEQLNIKKRYKMKVVEQSYEIFNLMLADESLTIDDKINHLNAFITTVNDAMFKMILSSDELKECCDLLTTFDNKRKELEVLKDV